MKLDCGQKTSSLLPIPSARRCYAGHWGWGWGWWSGLNSVLNFVCYNANLPGRQGMTTGAIETRLFDGIQLLPNWV